MSARAGSGCKKRKRIKLQCLVRDCNEIFDDDFRHTHNKKWRKDLVSQKKVIPYQVAGAKKILGPTPERTRVILSRARYGIILQV